MKASKRGQDKVEAGTHQCGRGPLVRYTFAFSPALPRRLLDSIAWQHLSRCWCGSWQQQAALTVCRLCLDGAAVGGD